MRLYNCTAAFVPIDECTFLLGDNSDHNKPNPWRSAIRIVHLLGMATDGVDDYRVSRHYTIRLANSPEDDDGLVKARQIASNQEKSGGGDMNPTSVSESNESSSSVMMLACRILVDGGDDDSGNSERLKRVPEHLWHPNPVPPGRSAFSTSGPYGGYVLMQDMPKPVLEEEVVGFVGLRSLHPPSSDEVDGHGEVAKGCEISKLYVDPVEHECLCYVLVDLMAEHAKSAGLRTLRLAPEVKTGIANTLFEKAGKAARRIQTSEENTGEAWEMDLDLWSPPAGVIIPT